MVAERGVVVVWLVSAELQITNCSSKIAIKASSLLSLKE